MKYGNPRPAAHNSGYNSFDCIKTISYCNYTGTDVTIIGRDGFPIYLKTKTSDASLGTFNIYVKYKCDSKRGVYFNSHGSLYAENTEERRELESELFKSAKPIGPNGVNRQRDEYEVVYRIPMDELRENGSMYFELLDIVISVEDVKNLPKHPRTSSAVLDELDYNVKNNTLNFNLFVVDKSATQRKRFIRIGDLVYEVPIYTTHTFPNGIYIVTKEEGNKKRTKKHYLLNDSKCPIKLYHSQEEAENYGDPDSQAERKYREEVNRCKQREMEIKKQLEDLRIKAEQQKMEFEERSRMFRINADKEKVLLEEELSKRRDSREEQKHKREDTSSKRKALVEWLKVIPPVASVITLFMTLWASRR